MSWQQEDSLDTTDRREGEVARPLEASVSSVEVSWLAAPLRLDLPQDSVHVWRIAPFVPAPQSQASVLSADERERARRLRRECDRTRFIGTRAAVRAILAAYLNTSADTIAFTYGRHGRPELVPHLQRSGLRFSVSHSARISLCAVSARRRVGIDVEEVRDDLDVLGIADTFFTASEARRLRSLSAPERPRAFFEYWTAKEAYLKALGEGLAGLGREHWISDGWSAWRLQPGEGYIATLVADGAPGRLAAWQWIACPGGAAANRVAASSSDSCSTAATS